MGIVQLFEYNHFEVAEYKRNRGIQPATEHQLLDLSRRPGSSEDSQAYLGFINSLNIRAAAVQDGAIQPLGDLTGAEELIG